MNQEKIGKFIAQCRVDKNITQAQLAEKLGVSNKTISRWENGRNMPDYSILKDLCNVLDIDVNEFLSGEKIKKDNYEIKYNENIDNILREYYKIKKQRNIVKNILIIVFTMFIILFVRILMVVGVVTLTSLTPFKNISGIENYNKNYYIEEYGGDLDSNLSIFPDDKLELSNAEFSSSLQTNFFDSDGYILLKAKYSKEIFDKEVNRIKNLSMIISNDCNNSLIYENKIKYDETAYKYPAYITIDGYGYTYEYALINELDLEIIYVYLSHPNKNNSKYKSYLKNDKSEYSKIDTLNMYSMYNHSFDNGNSFMEFNDCK